MTLRHEASQRGEAALRGQHVLCKKQVLQVQHVQRTLSMLTRDELPNGRLCTMLVKGDLSHRVPDCRRPTRLVSNGLLLHDLLLWPHDDCVVNGWILCSSILLRNRTRLWHRSQVALISVRQEACPPTCGRRVQTKRAQLCCMNDTNGFSVHLLT